MKNRYSFRLLTIGTMLIASLTAPAQQTATGPGGADNDGHAQRASQDGAPKVEPQLKMLTEKLDLTGDQQTRVKPILQELHDATQRVMKDESMSRDERLDHVKTSRYRADRQIREILNDDQKKKLDQVESEPHPELHGD
jgi:Spy/CpxP family protein refolding chaperone